MLVNPNLSVFKEVKNVTVPPNKKFIFVSDHFNNSIDNLDRSMIHLSNFANELSFNVKTSELSHNFLEENRDKLFIFGGLNSLNWKLVPDLISAYRYCIVETELKFCKHKSPSKHKIAENVTCNCHNEQIGKVVEEFYLNSEMIFWFSEEQMNMFHDKLPRLKNIDHQTIITQVLSKNEFDLIDELSKSRTSNDKYCVLNNNNILDGTFEAIKFCAENNLQSEVLNISDYKNDLEFINKLSEYKGIVYIPVSSQISPRFLIQAKLLNLELLTNNSDVDIIKLDWFNNQDLSYVKDYLSDIPSNFLRTIEMIYQTKFKYEKLSSYVMFDNNDIDRLELFISNFIDICDEIMIGLFDVNKEININNDKINIFRYSSSEFGNKELAKDVLRKTVTGQYVLELSPEYKPENNFKTKLDKVIINIPKKADFYCLPVLFKDKNDIYKQNKEIKYWREILSKNIKLDIRHKNNSEIDKRANNGLVTNIDANNGNLSIYLDFTQNIKIYDHLFYDLDVNNVDNCNIYNNICETLAYKYPTINIME